MSTTIYTEDNTSIYDRLSNENLEQSSNITVDDYNVKMKPGVTSFTEKHLNLHLSIHNPRNVPEHYNLFNFGLVYDKTTLMSVKEFKSKLFNGQNFNQFHVQDYRRSKNKKYDSIATDIHDNGVDIRSKMLSVVMDENDRIEALFSGNTFFRIITETTNFDNLIVKIFRKTKLYNESNRIKVGVYLNRVDKESERATDDDLEYSLDKMDDEGAFGNLGAKPSEKSKEKFISKIRKTICEMMKISDDAVRKSKYDKMIYKIMNKHIKEEELCVIDQGSQVIDYLSTTYPGEYSNNRKSHFISLSSQNKPRTIHSQMLVFRRHFWDKSVSPLPFDFEKGSFNVIMHGGTPKPSDSVTWFFKHFDEMYKDFDDLDNFLLNHYFRPVDSSKEIKNVISKNTHLEIIGVFQQVRQVEKEFPNLKYKTVISRDDFYDAYRKYKTNNPSKFK